MRLVWFSLVSQEYIPEEGLGIRLEDDLVVQQSGSPFNLMSDIPLEVEEIEDAMNS